MQFNYRKFESIRKRNKITQVQVAQKIGCSQSTIQNWESGKIVPHRIDMSVIADAIGCKASDLIDDYLPLPPAGKYAALADDAMLPMFLDAWLQAGVVEKAQLIERARELIKKNPKNAEEPEPQATSRRNARKPKK